MEKSKRWFLAVLFAILFLGGLGRTDTIHASAAANTVKVSAGAGKETPDTGLFGLDSFICRKAGDSEYDLMAERMNPNSSISGKFEIDLEPGKYEYQAKFARGVDDSKEIIGTREATFELPADAKKFNISFEVWGFYVDFDPSVDLTALPNGWKSWLSDLSISLKDPEGKPVTLDHSIIYDTSQRRRFSYILSNITNPAGAYTVEVNLPEDSKFDVINENNLSYSPRSITENAKFNNSYKTKNLTITSKKYKHTIKVPQGAGLQLYFQEKDRPYKVRKAVDADTLSLSERKDGYDIWTYTNLSYARMVYVAGGEGTDYIQTTGFFDMNAEDSETTLTVPKKGTVYTTAEKSNDLYTNVVDGVLRLSGKGASSILDAFRVTQPVANDVTSEYIEPDMKYEILFGDDVISLTDAEGSGFGRIRKKVEALKDSGFAVIKITYEDMYKNDPQGSAMFPSMLPALSDTNTGTVLVQVGGTSDGITPIMTQYDRGTDGQSAIRNDFDTVYFLGTTTLPGKGPVPGKGSTEYTFNAGVDTEVSVHDPMKTTDTSFDNGAWRPYDVDAQGNCTVTLKDGRNPIKITKGESVYYTVINAKELNVTIENLTDRGKEIKARDKVGVSFDGLELPVYKMTTVYNPGWKEHGDQTWVEYTLNGKDTADSPHIQYPIATTNTIEFTAAKGENILSQGQIHCTHMGSALYVHTGIPESGGTPNTDAVPGSNSPWFNILPEITFEARALTEEEEKDATVREVEELIDKVADYRDDPRYAMTELLDALDAYEALDVTLKPLVSNADVLTEVYYGKDETDIVRRMVAVIRDIQKLPEPDNAAKENAVDIQNAKTEFDALGEENTILIPKIYRDKLSGLADALEQILVNGVIDMITDLGDVTAANCIEKQEAIRQARAAYEALSESARKKVMNLSDLEKAEALLRAADPAMAAVEDQIKAIGGVTAANWKERQGAIAQARAAYEALSEESKARVSNLKTLTDAEAVVSAGQAEEVIVQINAIGDVTADNWNGKQTAIGQARAAYNALPESAQALVTNLGRLQAAEATVQDRTAAINDAVAKINAIGGVTADNWKERRESIRQARAAYDALSTNERSQITGAEALTAAEAFVDQGEAGEVTAQIAAIGEVTAANWREKQEAIGQARTAYNALSANAKTLVPNLAALEAAEAAIQAADAAAADVIAKITAIGEVTIENWNEKQAAVTGARAAYEALTQQQRALVTNYPALTAAEAVVADAQAVKAVVDRIAAIGEVTAENWKEKDAAIAEARTAYDALQESQRALVSGYAALQAAEGFIQTDVVDPVKAKIDQIGTLSETDCREKEPLVREARAMYDGLTDRLRAMISNYAVLENAEAFLNEYDAIDHEMKAFQESAVQGLKAEAVFCTAVRLTWDPLRGADSYRVYRRVSGGAWSQIAAVSRYGYTDDKAAVGKAYAYRVAGVSSRWGGGVMSRESTIATCTLKLGKTTLTSVRSKDYRTLKLTWKRVTGATGYTVYRAAQKNGAYRAIAQVKKGGATTYEDTKRTTGVTYHYRVRAYRTVNGETGYGEPSAIKSGKASPAAPKTSVKSGRRSAAVKWSSVRGATGYQVYRSAKKDGGYKKIADVKKRSYADKGLKSKKTYHYRVRAYRTVGKKRVYGSFSAVKTVRTR